MVGNQLIKNLGTSNEERNWAMILHLSVFSAFFLPFLGAVLVPLIIWLLKKDTSSFVNDQGKEVINFNVSIMLYIAVCSFVAFIFLVSIIGIPFILILIPFAVLVVPFWFVCTIIGAIRAQEGVYYRYPLSVRFVK